MSLILTAQNPQPLPSQRPSNQELLQMAIDSAKRAAYSVNGVENMRQLSMSDLQLVAFNLRLTLETLDLIKRRNINE